MQFDPMQMMLMRQAMLAQQGQQGQPPALMAGAGMDAPGMPVLPPQPMPQMPPVPPIPPQASAPPPPAFTPPQTPVSGGRFHKMGAPGLLAGDDPGVMAENVKTLRNGGLSEAEAITQASRRRGKNATDEGDDDASS